MLKNLPIGRENFKDLIEEDFYYVDKTDIIETLLKNKNYVSLFPRPRRFGKSLFISMMDNFFNIEYAGNNDNLFERLKISKSEYYKELSTRPVIKLDFKNLKKTNFEGMYNSFREMIRELYSNKRYLLDVLKEDEKNVFDSFIFETASREKCEQSVRILSNFMYKYYNKKVVILIDEYDVPIQEGYLNDCYDEVVGFIRNVLSSALKGNDNLEFAIMTGVLRVSKESLFSDLNNVEVYGITNKQYNECFGFTNNETKELLEYYDLKLTQEVKEMYDGYNFNGVEIFNPWSILNYAKHKELEPYWVNTSGNELLKKTLNNTFDNIKVTIEKLLSGEVVLFAFDDKVTYLDFKNTNNQDNILNLLFTSGYLTLAENISEYSIIKKCRIPNKEIKITIYKILSEYITTNTGISSVDIFEFTEATINNDKYSMEKSLNKMLPKVSFMDEHENFYHGYVLGIFSFLLDKNYIVKSNREAGSGRFDVMIESSDRLTGMIIEFKITKDDMEEEAHKGLEQIEEKEYYKELIIDKVKDIRKCVIVFKNKSCIVR